MSQDVTKMGEDFGNFLNKILYLHGEEDLGDGYVRSDGFFGGLHYVIRSFERRDSDDQEALAFVAARDDQGAPAIKIQWFRGPDGPDEAEKWCKSIRRNL